VTVASPGSPVNRVVSLTATPEVGGATPDTVAFQICLTTADCAANQSGWRELATVGPQLDDGGNPTGNYVTALDTTTLPDGSYDAGVTAKDAGGDDFQGGVVGNLVVDNTPPTVALHSPGASLSGNATLTASAEDAGSGVAAVKYEVSPAGAGDWTTVGVSSSPP